MRDRSGLKWREVFSRSPPDSVVGDDFALRQIRVLARKQVYQSFGYGTLLSVISLVALPIGAQDFY